MTLTGLDIVVLIAIGGAAALGFTRGFVTEVLALMAWVLVVLAINLFHTPFSAVLTQYVGTEQGAAVLAFSILSGGTYFGGRLIARAVGARTRDSFLGPIDRALGFGFGALKGLILASMAFLLVVLVLDTLGGGASKRPEWIIKSTTYPLLNSMSAGIADVVDRRRKGEPMFGDADDSAENASIRNSSN